MDRLVLRVGLFFCSHTLTQALDAGEIDHGEIMNETILQNADLVILTLYPSAIINFVKTHREEFKKGLL